MKKILAYTFTSFPLEKGLLNANVQVFKKLNDDISTFCEEIRISNPDLIVGFALSKNKQSTVERYTINKFQRDKRVIKGAPDAYEMDIPKELVGQYRIRTSATNSFCNLSMFKIKHFLKENTLNIPFVFIHVAKNDVNAFVDHLNEETSWVKNS